MSDLPDPLVPPDVDLRDLDGFMLNVERLMSSELWALSTGEEFKAAVALWCRSWKQMPAASLPSNERILASWAGVPLDRWRELREIAMRGFVLCSDGRFYHRVLAEDALRAWEKKKTFRERSAKGNAKRWHSDQTSGSIGTPTDPPKDAEPSDNPATDPTSIIEGSESLPQGTEQIQQGVLEPPQGQGQGQEISSLRSDSRPKPDKPVRTRKAYPEDLDVFWKAFPTDPNMSKAEAAKAWTKLTKDDRASAIAAIPGFVAYCRAHSDYRPVHAVRFLTQRRFEGYLADQPHARGSPDAGRIDFGGGVTASAAMIREYDRKGQWLDQWGPRRGQPGCKVPETVWTAEAA